MLINAKKIITGLTKVPQNDSLALSICLKTVKLFVQQIMLLLLNLLMITLHLNLIEESLLSNDLLFDIYQRLAGSCFVNTLTKHLNEKYCFVWLRAFLSKIIPIFQLGL